MSRPSSTAPPGLLGEGALLVDENTPHLGNDSHLRRGIRDGMGGQPMIVEVGEIDLPGGFDGMRFIVQRPAFLQHHMRHGAIGEAGVEMAEVVIVGDASGERALSGSRRAVDGDDE